MSDQVVTGWEGDFDVAFPCPCEERTCDQNGTMASYDSDGDCEPQQCEWCFRNRLPVKDFIRALLSHQKALSRAEVLEEISGKVEAERLEFMTYRPSRFNGKPRQGYKLVKDFMATTTKQAVKEDRERIANWLDKNLERYHSAKDCLHKGNCLTKERLLASLKEEGGV